MKVLNVTNNNGELEIRIDGYIIADEDKWLYDWFEYPSITPKEVRQVLEGLEGKPLTIKTNSYGGDVWSGSAIYTALKDYKGTVVVKIEGLAASAASVIAMAGDKVLMSPTAQMMIHNASTTASGDYNEMEKTAEFLKNVNEAIVNAYILKTGMEKKALLDLMNKETWLTVDQALEYGFVDEMMFSEQKIEPAVSNLLMQKARNMYSCFNMPSQKAIKELKDKLNEQENGENTDNNNTEQDMAEAMLEIENNRY